MTSTKEYKHEWRAKKLAEDSDYFKKQYRRYRDKKLAKDPEYFKKKSKEQRERHPEMAKIHRERYLAKHPKAVAKSVARWRRKNVKKYLAQVYGLRYGKLKDKCEFCESTDKLERHHPDYSKPLEFLTLCKDCHELLHAELGNFGVVENEDSIVFLNRHCDNCGKTFPDCGKKHPSFNGRSCSKWIVKQSEESK